MQWLIIHLAKIPKPIVKIGLFFMFEEFANTDLGSLIGYFDWDIPNVWKFSNFPAILVLCEYNSGWFLSKIAFITILKALIETFRKISNVKLPKIQNSELLKWSKWQLLGFQKDQNWFEVKSERQKNPEISTLCIPN